MKKNIIAIAVATLASTAAFAQSNVTVYGTANVGFEATSVNNGGVAKNRVEDQGSYIGFKGSEDLGGGLKAIFQIESGVNLTGSTNGTGVASTLATRNSYVGLNGGFGTVLMGTHDTPYKMSSQKLNLFKETTSDYNAIIGEGPTNFDLRAGNVIAYVSPNYNGLSGAIAHVANENKTTGISNTSAWSLGLNYEQGPLFASYGFEKQSDTVADVDNKAHKVTAGYTFAPGSFAGVIYERINADTAGVTNNRNAWGLAGQYAMGNIAFKGQYIKANDWKNASDSGSKLMTIGVDYSLSKRTVAYAQYSQLTNDSNAARDFGYNPVGNAVTGMALGQDARIVGVGLKHSF